MQVSCAAAAGTHGTRLQPLRTTPRFDASGAISVAYGIKKVNTESRAGDTFRASTGFTKVSPFACIQGKARDSKSASAICVTTTVKRYVHSQNDLKRTRARRTIELPRPPRSPR
jgi:hypothetical protein